MRAGPRLTFLIALPLAALALVGQVAHGDDPADGGRVPVVAAAGATGTRTATRGVAFQETPIPEPPPAELPPATTPPGTDRNIIHLDWLELPPDSGSGRRVVYSKTLQRVWLVEEDGSLYNTHRVSGRMDQPNPGTYSVFSRSTTTCSNAHSNICMRWMVRFAHARSGDNIGFHEIPRRDGVPLQTEEMLGAPLSGGCVRQSTSDAMLMWDWAQLGTVVVVLP